MSFPPAHRVAAIGMNVHSEMTRPALRQALAAHRRRFYNLAVNPDSEITVTAGATASVALRKPMTTREQAAARLRAASVQG